MLTPYWNVLNDEAKVTTAQSATYLYEVQFHSEFAIPLACFCFVLIGAVAGPQISRRRHRARDRRITGESSSASTSCCSAAKGSPSPAGLNPAVAMYVPLLLFTLIGVFAVNSTNREMGTSRSGGLLDALMGLFQGGRD